MSDQERRRLLVSAYSAIAITLAVIACCIYIGEPPS